MLKDIKRYVVLEPHVDDFELGCLPLILKNSKPFIDVHTPVAEVHILSFCLGRNEENWKLRANARTKTIEILQKRGILVEWRNIPTKKYDTELNDSLINDHCEYINFYIRQNLVKKGFIFLIPQIDLHPDHNHVNLVGKIISRKFINKPVLEYIIWNSKDNPNIIQTNWNIDIGETKIEDGIILDKISEIFEGEFYKLKNCTFNKKYNLIKYNI